MTVPQVSGNPHTELLDLLLPPSKVFLLTKHTHLNPACSRTSHHCTVLSCCSLVLDSSNSLNWERDRPQLLYLLCPPNHVWNLLWHSDANWSVILLILFSPEVLLLIVSARNVLFYHYRLFLPYFLPYIELFNFYNWYKLYWQAV